MKNMTEENLKAAFAGESQAHLKYLAFSEKAEQDGRANVARLFAAASFSEQIHAKAHLKTLSGIGGTSENLAGAIGGEAFEVNEMYPAFMAVSEKQEESAATRSFLRAFEAEKIHGELYTRAKTAVDAGADVYLDDVWVCGHCGFTTEGAQPDKCPFCGAPRERFSKF